jgi:formylglycine-generating enzyme required for sulfatase activity
MYLQCAGMVMLLLVNCFILASISKAEDRAIMAPTKIGNNSGLDKPKQGKSEEDKPDAGLTWVLSKSAGIEFTKSEVTVGQYRACFKAGRCEEPNMSHDPDCSWGYTDRETHPVNCVSFEQAAVFCEWAGGRLPTEDEWYMEASDGGRRKYPWGDAKVSCDTAIWRESKDMAGCGRDSTWPVCSKEKGKSVSGLCDMSGNVWEWTTSTAEGFDRVLRGGSWHDSDPGNLQASYRDEYYPARRYDYRGFRCVRPSPSPSE